MSIKLSEKKLATLLHTVGEDQRLRILCHLYRERTSCVSEIAAAVHGSVANTSHHLHTLARAGVLTRARSGKTVCYSVAESQFTTALKKLICTISSL